jgi:uncharacterized protein YbjT (DUF2867 family)
LRILPPALRLGLATLRSNPDAQGSRIGSVNNSTKEIFIAGGSGYMGRQLIPELMARGHRVKALVRRGSESKIAAGCTLVAGDALDKRSYVEKIAPADTFVHLVGVAHPSPAKAAQFRSIDLVAGRAAIEAAVDAGVKHFVYLSVAHPAPMMKAYIDVRMECEALIQQCGLNATILRPWYVLGPGHRWPYALIPFYWVMSKLPATRDGAQRLGLVTLDEMVAALVEAIESPVQGVSIRGVPEIRAAVKLS